MAAKSLALLKQYWFFVGVIVVLTAGYAAYAPLARLSSWQVGPYPLRTWLITLTMVFTAFTLPLKNIGAGVRNWVGLMLLVVTSFAVYPAAAWAVAHLGWWLQGTHPQTQPLADWSYGAGLIIMAAVPTTLASGIIWTRQGGGDDALALVGMVLSLCASIFVTPVLLGLTLFPLFNGHELHFDAATVRGKLVFNLMYLILIPVAIGQGARLIKKVGAWGDRHRGRISISLQLIVLTTIGLSVAGQMADSAKRTGPGSGLPSPRVLAVILASTVVIHVAVLGAGWCLSRWTRRSRAVTIAVALNGAQKTLPVAILVETLLPGSPGPLDGAVWTFITVHVTQLLLDAALLPKMKWWSEAEAGTASGGAGTPAAGDLPAEAAGASGGGVAGASPPVPGSKP